MTRQVNIIYGPPGTGKTTHLLNNVEMWLERGCDPSRIAFLSFSKRAAQEAITRACERFKMSASELPWFRTAHSAAYKLLGLRHGDVMQLENLNELSQLLPSFPFIHQYRDTWERAPQGGAMGDHCLQLYSLARSGMTSVKEAWQKYCRVDVSLHNAEHFAKVLDLYKSQNQLLDFSDFLDEAQGVLDIDVLFVDEAQDLTPQQWQFIRRVGQRAGTVYIAGDDDQAIYGWAGADVRYFLSIAGDRLVLPLSHRLPSEVHQLAIIQVKRIRHRVAKDFKPKQEPGRVTVGTALHTLGLDDEGTWLLLGRTNSKLKDLITLCRDQGRVYMHKGRWSNQEPPVRAAVAYEDLRAGRAIAAHEVRRLARYIPDLTVNSRQEEYRWGDIEWGFEGEPPWYVALASMGKEQEAYIRRLRREGESLRSPGRVVVSTIHGAKGAEADHVVIRTDIDKRVRLGIEDDPDQEARVWYVAASRARQSLTLLQPTRQLHYQMT